MSSPSQLDLHPDADSLNAFVEQLLTEPERAQILTHLAGCARCREVIFVAQRAVYAMEPEFLVAAAAAPSVTLSPAPAPAPAPAQIQAVPRPWRAASIPAAALAAAIALSVFAYVAHTREASELARNAARPANPTETVQPQPHAQKESTPSKSAETSNVGKQAVRKRSSSDRAAAAPPAIYLNTPMPLSSPVPPLISGKNAPPSASRPMVQSFSAAQFRPAPPVLTPQRVSGTVAGATTSSAAVQDHLKGVAQPSAPKAAEADSVTLSQLQIESASQQQAFSTNRQRLDSAFAAHAEALPILPSGLRASSTVTVQQHVLAVDSQGALFVSTDAGLHWTSVPQQWEGRVVLVRARTKPHFNTAGAISSAKTARPNETDAAGANSPLFEIVTENNRVWSSVDGTIWEPQSF